MPKTYIWRCEAGHESAHTEIAIRTMVVEPRCPVRLDDGAMCWKRLSVKVRPFPTLKGDVCLGCGRTIGRAGRTNKEVTEDARQGKFLTAVGITDYSTELPTTAYYCWQCWEQRVRRG